MRADQLRRSERQPLIERYVSVVVALEDFQEAQHRVAGILDVVPHGKGHVTDIVGLKVEGAGLARGGEHAHAGLPFDVILPLVRIRVPVQLAHRAGRDLDQRCGDGRGYREHFAVGDAYRSAFRPDRRLCHHPVAEALWDLGRARNLVGAERPRHGRREDVKLAWIRDTGEHCGTPKFLASTSGGVCLIQSLSRKVLSSSKSPSSNTRRNSAPSGPRPWIECGIPGGKYHRSPTPTSSTKLRPCESIAVMRAVP